MARSPYFPKKHVYLLLLILCKAQPNKLFNHWKTIRNIHFLFVKELKEKGIIPSSYSALRSELSRILDIEQIQDLQNSIKLLCDYCPEDEWLVHVLHNGSLEMHSIPERMEITLAFSNTKDISVYESSYKHKSFGQGFIKVISNESPDVMIFLINKLLSVSQIVYEYNVSIFNLKPKIENTMVEHSYCEVLAPIAGINEEFLKKGLLV